LIKLEISGDYVDAMSREFKRLFDFRFPWKMLKPFMSLLQKYRRNVPESILTSGGCGTLALLKLDLSDFEVLF
jgi:hypothetical protein